MKKIILLVLAIGLLTFTSTAIADDKPRTKFKTPFQNIQVFTFFDVKLANLCYVTQNSIFCIPYVQMDQIGRNEIQKLIKQTPKDIVGDPPDTIRIH